MIPLAGQGINLLVNRFNDKWYDDKVSLSPAVSMLESAASLPYTTYKAIAEDGSWKRPIRDTLTLLGIATGLPLGALGRPLGYIADVEQGRIEPANAADFARGLISGRGQ
jgi:hypothetical protein